MCTNYGCWAIFLFFFHTHTRLSMHNRDTMRYMIKMIYEKSSHSAPPHLVPLVWSSAILWYHSKSLDWNRCVPQEITRWQLVIQECSRSCLFTSFWAHLCFALHSPFYPLPPPGLRPAPPKRHQDGLRGKPLPAARPLHTSTFCRQPNHIIKGTIA